MLEEPLVLPAATPPPYDDPFDYDETERIRLYKAIVRALMTDTASGGKIGLPVPPLLELVSYYAVAHWDGSVVSTVIGAGGQPGTANGKGADARLYYPYALCAYPDPKTGEETILINDTFNYLMRLYVPSTQMVSTFMDLHGFGYARSMALDPTNPKRFYFCSDTTIQCWEEGAISLVAGDGPHPNGRRQKSKRAPAANAAAVTFSSLFCMLISRDGRTLYTSEEGQSDVRSVDVKSRTTKAVTRKLGSPTPHGVYYMTWDRSLPETGSDESSVVSSGNPVIYAAAHDRVVRINVDTGEYKDLALSVELKGTTTILFYGITCTQNGTLLVACVSSHYIFAIEPKSGTITRLAGSPGDGNSWLDGPALKARFHSPRGLLLAENDKVLYIVDNSNNAIRKMTLPPRLYSLKAAH